MITQLVRSTMRKMSNTSAHPKTVVALYCTPENPALRGLPELDNVEFVRGETEADFASDQRFQKAEALVVIPPSNNAKLTETIYPKYLTSVRWVHSFFAGVDAMQQFTNTHLVSSETPLTNGRGAFSDSLAEYVMCSALHFNKQVPRWQQNSKDKNWDHFNMNVMRGKTIGFLGFGHIAQTTARMAKMGFGMKVIAVSRSGKTDQDGLADIVYGIESKSKLFQESDFVVCTLPGTPETFKIVGKDEFAEMKNTGVFISCGRGTCVDEDALAAALTSGEIMGAALDVFQVEPLPESSPLWGIENLLITAHNADLTDDYFDLGWKVWQNNFECFAAGTQLKTLVQKSAGY